MEELKMKMVELAREIGREIQKDGSYISVKAAEQACDEDKVLQELIGEFNMKRMNLNQEASKTEKDEEKITCLNEELRECYDKVMANENMNSYNNAKTELEHKLKEVIDIISMCAEGADPDTVQSQPSCSCDCSSCGGCH